MKRFLLALALGAGLLACSETEIQTAAAGLSGTYDLTIVDKLVFVTSSDRDELRVLDLTTTPRDYVRAPNPLEPLSIPVLDRPIALSRDVRYNAEGEEVAGPYVYARSAGSQEISVVGADFTQLRELRRLVAPGLVTAIAARGPSAEGGRSQLFYATQSASGAQVWMQELPGPDELNAQTVLPERRLVVTLTPGETVQALLVLPPVNRAANPPVENSLAIATRWGVGSGGRTVKVDLMAPGQFVELRFGAPVRQLATHAQLPEVPALGQALADRRRPPGSLIFGVLDEGACRLPTGCSGVLAVESATGQLAKDLLPVRNQAGEIVEYREGAEMLPVTVGAALPTGLTLAANAQLLVTNREGGKVIDRIPLLAIVPASNGEFTLFNALELRHFDFDPAAASAEVTLRDAAEQEKTTGRTGVLSATVVHGATLSDIYRVIFQGVLPGLGGLAHEPGTPFVIPRAASERVGVRAGDLLILEDPTTGPCPQDVTVTQVQPGPEADSVTLLTTPLPEACAAYPRFSLRAAANQPFTVVSERQGYLTRLAAGESYTVPGSYFYRPDEFNPAVPPVQVTLALNPTQEALVRGDRYLVNVNGHFVPYIVRVNTTDVNARLTNYRLPASVVYAVANDGVDYAYIAYPSADGVLQMNLELLYFEQVNDRGLRSFE